MIPGTEHINFEQSQYIHFFGVHFCIEATRTCTSKNSNFLSNEMAEGYILVVFGLSRGHLGSENMGRQRFTCDFDYEVIETFFSAPVGVQRKEAGEFFFKLLMLHKGIFHSFLQ